MSIDKRRVRLRSESNPLITLILKGGSPSSGDSASIEIKLSSLIDAGTLLTIQNAFYILYREDTYAIYVDIISLSSIIIFGASSFVATILFLV